MSPNRFREKREKREVTPFIDEPIVQADIPEEWRRVEAPINFTWVIPDELAGMGWPKSRDQLRFLLDQGIDQLVTLSADKIPPYYAFPELQHSLIPVEDFKGPAISDIQRFINIMDDARKQGEAVAVHCAEGRGRTGVMCACYLIYYHDLKPWDAIRIMRRQRPGSVERRTQEDTVVRFYNLLQEYGKHSLEILDEKEREWLDERRREKESRINCENLLGVHTATFYGPWNPQDQKLNRKERILRMRRCRSMPKMTPEEENSMKSEVNFQSHIQNFYHEHRCRSQPRDRTKPQPNLDQSVDRVGSNVNGVLKGNTPTRILKDNLRPVSLRKSENSDETKEKCDYTKHFKQFMSGANVKRARSFSQPKEQEKTDERKEKQDLPLKEKSVQDCDEALEKNAIKHHEVRRSHSDSSRDLRNSTVNDNESAENIRPPQPNFAPRCVIDTSSTYSYYTRVRSRAAASRKQESSTSLEHTDTVVCSSIDKDVKQPQDANNAKDIRVKVKVKEVSEVSLNNGVLFSDSSSVESLHNIKRVAQRRSSHSFLERRPSLAETPTHSFFRPVSQLDLLDCTDQISNLGPVNFKEAIRSGFENKEVFDKNSLIYRRSRTGPLNFKFDEPKQEEFASKSKECASKSLGETCSPFSRDNWKRINHRYNNNSSLLNHSFTRETYV